MTQRDLHRAVAKATGESVERIAHMGFNVVIQPRPNYARMRQAIRARRARLGCNTVTPVGPIIARCA